MWIDGLGCVVGNANQTWCGIPRSSAHPRPGQTPFADAIAPLVGRRGGRGCGACVVMQAMASSPARAFRATPPLMASAAASNELDEDTCAATLFDSDFDGLAIVKFYAPWCRTCRTTKPTYDRMVNKISSETSDSEVRFFEVNFKECKNLCLRERVFALPAVHFYTRSLGRINRFTLSPVNAASKMRREVDRYIGGSQHLSVLKELDASGESAVSPLVRWNYLVGLLEAVANADTYLAEVEENNLTTLAELLENDDSRLAELQATSTGSTRRRRAHRRRRARGGRVGERHRRGGDGGARRGERPGARALRHHARGCPRTWGCARRTPPTPPTLAATTARRRRSTAAAGLRPSCG